MTNKQSAAVFDHRLLFVIVLFVVALATNILKLLRTLELFQEQEFPGRDELQACLYLSTALLAFTLARLFATHATLKTLRAPLILLMGIHLLGFVFTLVDLFNWHRNVDSLFFLILNFGLFRISCGFVQRVKDSG